MLERNTMMYGQDGLSFRRRALLKSRQPLDFTYETSCSGLNISGTEPTGTSRRIVFEIDGKLFRFVNNLLDIYDERGEFADIIREGNTVGELLALTENELAAFVGKKVYPWIALEAPADSAVMPKIKISANVKSYNDVYTKTTYSPIYELKRSGDACKITDVVVNKTTNGNAIATVKCKFRHPVRGWSEDWVALSEVRLQLATAIQFQITYVLTTLDGSDSAEITSVDVRYTTDSDRLSGEITEIVTAPQEFYSDLGTCYALIKHSELRDCTLQAYVHFSQPAVKRENVLIGVGTGASQEIIIKFNGVVEKNIAQDTIHLEVGGKTFSGFHFDTQNSTITLTAEVNAPIYASYECNTEDDLWREMTADTVTEREGIFSSRFIFRLTDSTNKKVSAVKFRFSRNSGHVESQFSSTGKVQMLALPHRAIAETVSCGGNWKYDETSQILKVVAATGENISVSYDWRGDFPDVEEYIVGWCAKI